MEETTSAVSCEVDSRFCCCCFSSRFFFSFSVLSLRLCFVTRNPSVPHAMDSDLPYLVSDDVDSS